MIRMEIRLTVPSTYFTVTSCINVKKDYTVLEVPLTLLEKNKKEH